MVLCSMWLSQGSSVGTGAAGPMMLGSQSVVAFGLMFAYLLPMFGVGTTAIVSWLFGICCFSIPSALALRWLAARDAEKAASAAAATAANGRAHNDTHTVTLDYIDQ